MKAGTAGRIRAGAAAGITGPALFTGAWVVSSFRQTGHPVASLQIIATVFGNGLGPFFVGMLSDAYGGYGSGQETQRYSQPTGRHLAQARAAAAPRRESSPP